jgi:hypothetical protein
MGIDPNLTRYDGECKYEMAFRNFFAGIAVESKVRHTERDGRGLTPAEGGWLSDSLRMSGLPERVVVSC